MHWINLFLSYRFVLLLLLLDSIVLVLDIYFPLCDELHVAAKPATS